MPEPHVRLLRRIASSADRMGRMIHDLLDVTRSRLGGGLPLEPKPIDLVIVCKQVIDELEIAHSKRTIELDAPSEVPGVWDPDRLAQVVSNLLGNALDYGAPETPVRVTVDDRGAEVSLSVNNQGPAIEPDAAARLFDPFQQGAQDGRATRGRGLGLGLFIVKAIVEAHGGSIAVASTPDAGTTFHVRLPRSA
jgi:signal transduction histidine kinase